MINCPKCGSQVPESMAFCGSCGTQMAVQTPIQPQQPQYQQQPIQQPQPQYQAPMPPPPPKKSSMLAIVAVIIVFIVIIAISGIFLMNDFFNGGNVDDISIRVTDSDWDWFGYYCVDVTFTNNGDGTVDISIYSFDIMDSNGEIYSVDDYDGNPPDSLSSGASASWTLLFDIPSDSNPTTLIYDDWSNHIEVDIP